MQLLVTNEKIEYILPLKLYFRDCYHFFRKKYGLMNGKSPFCSTFYLQMTNYSKQQKKWQTKESENY